MPLNQAQRSTLKSTLRIVLDAILESNEADLKEKKEWLALVLNDEHPSLAESLALLKNSPDLIKALSEAINIPKEIRRDWRLVSEQLPCQNPKIPEAVLNRLKKFPNFNPILLASMQKFEARLSGISEEIRIPLIRLRELYLEMTPMSSHRYEEPDEANGLEGSPVFYFRVGNTPLGLDTIGASENVPILPEEIQADVRSYIEERLELEEAYRGEIDRLNQQYQERMRQQAAIEADEAHAFSLYQEEIETLEKATQKKLKPSSPKEREEKLMMEALAIDESSERAHLWALKHKSNNVYFETTFDDTNTEIIVPQQNASIEKEIEQFLRKMAKRENYAKQLFQCLRELYASEVVHFDSLRNLRGYLETNLEKLRAQITPVEYQAVELCLQQTLSAIQASEVIAKTMKECLFKKEGSGLINLNPLSTLKEIKIGLDKVSEVINEHAETLKNGVILCKKISSELQTKLSVIIFGPNQTQKLPNLLIIMLQRATNYPLLYKGLLFSVYSVDYAETLLGRDTGGSQAAIDKNIELIIQYLRLRGIDKLTPETQGRYLENSDVPALQLLLKDVLKEGFELDASDFLDNSVAFQRIKTQTDVCNEAVRNLENQGVDEKLNAESEKIRQLERRLEQTEKEKEKEARKFQKHIVALRIKLTTLRPPSTDNSSKPPVLFSHSGILVRNMSGGDLRYFTTRTLPGLGDYYEVDVPADGTCLFYSVTFAFLLPTLNNKALFTERFIQLFGESVQEAAEENRERLLTYDGSPEFIQKHSQALEVLVNVNLRQRVVDYMQLHGKDFAESIPGPFEAYLNRMRNPALRDWGGQLEIKSMSEFLKLHITVYEREGQEIRLAAQSEYGQDFPNRIYLMHTLTSQGLALGAAAPRFNNHYHYLIPQTLMQKNIRGVKVSSSVTSPELPFSLSNEEHGINLPDQSEIQGHATQIGISVNVENLSASRPPLSSPDAASEEGKDNVKINILTAQAAAGNAAAQNSLGWCYANGEGVAKDEKLAADWFRKAADQGDAEAQYNLGRCYMHRKGVDKNEGEAVSWYRKAAEKGFAIAQCSLGQCYELGRGVLQDKREAVIWYRKAAEKGDMAAQNNLGWCYANGAGVAKDEKLAADWFRKAAEQGDAATQLNLGLDYRNGKGVAKDEKLAADWFRKAAEQGLAAAQFNLGLDYRNGKGVAKDEKLAADWFQKAAEQGLAAAQNSLGRCYENGEGVAKDEKLAADWFRKAAEQGHAAAQFNLGLCYENGKGIARDEKLAADWFRKAAEQGDAFPQNSLGLCYIKGKGVVKDEKLAADWFRKAAEQGHAGAQFSLGWCYINGKGVAKDEKLAADWFRKAAERGHAEAIDSLEQLKPGHCLVM